MFADAYISSLGYLWTNSILLGRRRFHWFSSVEAMDEAAQLEMLHVLAFFSVIFINNDI